MEHISIIQCHSILLQIAKEFDRVCTLYNIPYYMIGGTFLGAIRHKGFIPWDDDMDFGVPIEFYAKLLDILRLELKEPYRVCTYKSTKGCDTIFAKIDDPTTCVIDKCQDIPIEEQLGVNIDIFPLTHCDEENRLQRKLKYKLWLKRILFTESIEGQYYKHVLKKILRFVLPVNKYELYDDIWDTLLTIKGEKYMANLLGLVGRRELLLNHVWGDGIKYQFEDTEFRGPQQHDAYLSQIYGDYMKLPPLEKRKIHSSQMFIR